MSTEDSVISHHMSTEDSPHPTPPLCEPIQRDRAHWGWVSHEFLALHSPLVTSGRDKRAASSMATKQECLALGSGAVGRR